MVSLLLGLGGELFGTLAALGMPADAIRLLKLALFVGGLMWSLHLGRRILAGQGVPATRSWLPLLAGSGGALLLGAAWYRAILFT